MIPYLVSFTLSFIIEFTTPELTMFSNVASGIIYASHGLDLYINLAVNNLFKSLLDEYIQFVLSRVANGFEFF